jgi:hypothetical protein
MAKKTIEYQHFMQNPGDMRVPEGVIIIPKPITIITPDSLFNGHRPTDEEELQVIKETTLSTGKKG